MIRTLCLIVLLVAGLPGAAQQATGPAGPAQASDEVAARLWQALDLATLMPVLRDEALAEAAEMGAGMFESGSSIGWMESVARIHETARLEALFREALSRSLRPAAADRIDRALDFYEDDLGRRLVGLETTARQAMLDPDTEEAAREAFADAASRQAPRVSQIQRLIDEADLVGPNVAGGLNAAIAFSQGFAEGGGFDMPMSEEQMLADAWSQEAEIRAATLGWMEAYLMLAYSPLSDDDLERYVVFAGSSAGQALSALLFAGFDALFRQTSRDLGLAAASQQQGRDL